MAIQIDLINSQYGIPFNAAYFRIVTASISRTRDNQNRFSVMIDIAGYGTPTPGDETKEIDFRRYHIPLTEIESQIGAEFLNKCYAWVMSQADMSGSIAV